MSGGPGLPGALAHLEPLLDRGGYPALALLVGLDNVLVPVPGQTVLIVAAVYAGSGRMNVVAVALVAWAAALAGAEAAYLLGRRQGSALIERYGRYVRLTPQRYARAEDFYRRHGTLVVFAARFVDGLRQTNGLLAGANHLSRSRFSAANAVGAAGWTALWTALGYGAGTDIGPIYHQAVHYQLLLLPAAAVLAAGFAARALWHRHHRRADLGEPLPRRSTDS
ncbi:DedA family protein [Streptacidiphilus sp. P02-A3a]|uniref:DedA family protein n=1 Tax=Streptacidiphilus sp. P02-A3a TaxID=2704468 RepID=UPI0015FC5284|nr:DedA family protein [Streptacidiphilus sp. P02-A3a]QMU69919.1 DedA family protein [Streptacidiphilus sp. P02-A3a]